MNAVGLSRDDLTMLTAILQAWVIGTEVKQEE